MLQAPLPVKLCLKLCCSGVACAYHVGSYGNTIGVASTSAAVLVSSSAITDSISCRYLTIATHELYICRAHRFATALHPSLLPASMHALAAGPSQLARGQDCAIV